MSKFGSRFYQRPIRIMLGDLEMNDYRITGLEDPENDDDAATKHWVNLELELLNRKIGKINTDIEASIKNKVDRIECASTNGGLMNVDLNMQGHSIRNLPVGKNADEPITGGKYKKNWEELLLSMQSNIDAVIESTRVGMEALEGKILYYHNRYPNGRLSRP